MKFKNPLGRLKDTLGKAVSGAGDGVTSVFSAAEKETLRAYYGAADTVLGTVQSGRNVAEDIVQHGGALAGLVGGLAGEATLIMGGVFPFLVLGGLPSELGSAFAKQCAKASLSFRGTEPQFVAVRCEENMLKIFGVEDRVFAIMYDPAHAQADDAGFVQLDETMLAARGALFAQDRRSKATFAAALIALQETKLQHGLPLMLAHVSQSIEAGKTHKPKP